MTASRPLLVLCALAAVLVSGCGGADGPVRFLVFGEPEEINAFRAVVSAYEASEDGEIELIEASDRSDLIARLSTSIAAGAPPDVFLMNYRYYGQFASRGAIEPVENRLKHSDVFAPQDFYKAPLDAFRWQGEQLCLPQNVSSLAVYVNRDLFRRYGVGVPSGQWPWNELVRAAISMTRDATGAIVAVREPEGAAALARPAVYGLGIEPSIIRVAPFVWSNGGEVVDDLDAPSTLTLSEPRALAALDAFLGLRTGFGVVPSDEEVEAEDDETRFANGRLAMLIASRRVVPAFRTIESFEWDVVPLPVLMHGANVLHSDAYCIAAASDRKDAAWRFVEFALGPAGQRVVARTGRTVPSLVEVAQSEAFLDSTQPPASAHVFLDAIDELRPLPAVSTWPEIEDAVDPILESGFYLGWSAERVAREIDETSVPLFARAEQP